MKTPYTLIVERMLEIRKEIVQIHILLSRHDYPHIRLELNRLQNELEQLTQQRKDILK